MVLVSASPPKLDTSGLLSVLFLRTTQAMLRAFAKLEPSPSFAANVGRDGSQYPILYALGDNLGGQLELVKPV